MNEDVFVFGSNSAGKHGAGAAKCAGQHHGAVYGIGEGRTGNAYAIPTKDEQLNVLPLNEIEVYVRTFMVHARINPNERFYVTRVGCGLAGYTAQQIAPMFKNAPSNCILPKDFIEIIEAIN